MREGERDRDGGLLRCVASFFESERDEAVVERRVVLVLRVDPLRAYSFSAHLCG